MNASNSLFEKFHNALEDSKIKYAFIHSVEHLPNHIESDLDIVIDRSNLERFKDLLTHSEDWLSVQCIYHEYDCAVFILTDKKDSSQYLKLDVCVDYVAYGRSLISEKRLLKSIDMRNGWKQIALPEEFCYLLVKGLHKNKKAGDYIPYLKDISVGNEYDIKNALKINFGLDVEDVVSFCDRLVAEDGLKIKVKQEIMGHCKYDYKKKIKEWKRVLERILHPTGLRVCFVKDQECCEQSIERLKFFFFHQNSLSSMRGWACKLGEIRLLRKSGMVYSIQEKGLCDCNIVIEKMHKQAVSLTKRVISQMQ